MDFVVWKWDKQLYHLYESQIKTTKIRKNVFVTFRNVGLSSVTTITYDQDMFFFFLHTCVQVGVCSVQTVKLNLIPMFVTFTNQSNYQWDDITRALVICQNSTSTSSGDACDRGTLLSQWKGGIIKERGSSGWVFLFFRFLFTSVPTTGRNKRTGWLLLVCSQSVPWWSHGTACERWCLFILYQPLNMSL